MMSMQASPGNLGTSPKRMPFCPTPMGGNQQGIWEDK